jgi:PKD repeat protein
MPASCDPWPHRDGSPELKGNRRAPPAFLVLGACVALLLAQGCGKKDAVVNPQTGPTAGFSATPRSGVRPLDVDFADQSTSGSSPITSWLWSFGDGTTSTLRNTGHLYSSAGRYTVSLTVTTASGSNVKTQVDYIIVSDTEVIPPTARFSGTPQSGPAPLTVQFTDESTAGSSPIASRTWSFGDGGTSTAQSPSHTYTAPGSYTVSLIVRSPSGSDTLTQAGYIEVFVRPTAQFSGSPTTGQTPLVVQFTDQSTAGSAPITSWQWTFGDGGTSTARNPSHTYAAAGSYTVSLTVTTSAGQDTQTRTSYINVSSLTLPTALFSGSPTSGSAPLTVQFTDQSTSGSSPITSWSWSFGDGGTSTAQSPSHTYTAAGSYTVSLTVQSASGSDTETKSGYITAFVLPTANFSGSPRSGTVPLVVQFTDQSTPGSSPITSWSWSFGDGSTSTARNPSYQYTAAGSYTVSLKVTTSAGQDTQTFTNYVVVASPVLPTAQFSGSPTSGPAPLNVQFTDQSTSGSSPITSWFWSFGDGSTSTAQNPSYLYTTPGSYTVSLTVQSASGNDTQTRTSYIAVSNPTPPTAQFSGTPTSGQAPLAVQFTDQSTSGSASITSWSWTFGDGGTSTARNPSHTYTTAGSYTVRLIVRSSAGSDTLSRASYIGVFVNPNAEFSGTPTSGLTPLVVQFTDQSTPGSSSITSWSWTFGDGGTSTVRNPSHTYTAAGSYTVSLTVTTAAGQDTQTKTGYINASSPVFPTALFSGTPTSGQAPLAVQFTDQSTSGSSPITSWNWTFGDGGTSTAQNPSHTYTTAGSYPVRLIVRSSAGSDTLIRASYISVFVLPTADFTGSPQSGTSPLTVQFTDQSTAGSSPITSWSWSFGDGGTSIAQNPSHTYTGAGSYTVRLIVGSSAGSDTLSRASYIGVFVAPTANFSGSPRSGVSPLAVQFTDQSTSGSAPITSWSWTFGDGGTSTAQSPSHTYTDAGSYTVRLIVGSSAGIDTLSRAGYIGVFDNPTAEFSGTPTSGEAPLAVQFTDESAPGSSPITSWSWTFGDGGTSTAQNPSHTYASAGSYTVSLAVQTSVGSDTVTKSAYISVFVLPTADFSGSPQSGATPLAVLFTDQSDPGSSPITSWSWTFGDGGTSTAQNPSHTYTDPGSYTVRLIVGSSAGSDTLSRAGYIATCAPPVADFSAEPTGGLGPLTVQFTDQSSAGSSPITSWSWSFGDGGTSTDQNPSHIYLLPGSYTVSLTVGTACSDGTATKPDYITVSGLSRRMEALPGY